jgi:hypothetical protein
LGRATDAVLRAKQANEPPGTQVLQEIRGVPKVTVNRNWIAQEPDAAPGKKAPFLGHQALKADLDRGHRSNVV